MKKRSKVKGLLRVLVILETILLILIGKVLTESHAEKQAAKKEESVIKGEVVAETEEKQKAAEEKAMREKEEQEKKALEAQTANEQTQFFHKKGTIHSRRHDTIFPSNDWGKPWGFFQLGPIPRDPM